MSTNLPRYYALPGRQRWKGRAGLEVLDSAGHRDKVEVSVVPPDRTRDSVALRREAITLFRDALAKLVDAERVAVLSEDDELSPEQVATLLGMSRPLVVRRMEDG